MTDSIGKLGNYARSLYVQSGDYRVRVELDAVDDEALSRALAWVRTTVSPLHLPATHAEHSKTELLLGQAISDMLVSLNDSFSLNLDDSDLVAWVIDLMPVIALQLGARRKHA